MTIATSDISELMTAQTLQKIDLRSVVDNFVIANTPLFLLRKLRTDSVVREIARRAPSNTLERLLRKSLCTKPRKLITTVRPYVYLVALSMKNEGEILNRVALLAAPYHVWYASIASALLTAHKSTTIQNFQIPPIAVKFDTVQTSKTTNLFIFKER